MLNRTALSITATIFFVAVIVVNTLANALPINGLNTGEVSDLYPSLFTPAGITFSIWSVIYLLLTGFVVRAWIKKSSALISLVLRWFIVSCILNCSWILAWHYLYTSLSVVIMLLLLATLTRIFLLLQAHKPVVTFWERVFVYLPFTLYFAWICVATIANVSALLVSVSWQGGFLSPEQWTVTMMIIASLLGAGIALRYREPTYALVVLWAISGILLRWSSGEYKMIVTTAWVLVSVLAIVIIFGIRQHRIAVR